MTKKSPEINDVVEERKSNKEIIAGLYKLQRKHDLIKDRMKAMAYKKAIAVLKAFDHTITSSKQVSKLPGIGKAVIKKINEYFDNGKFRDVEGPYDEKKMLAIDELRRVPGIGDIKATELYDKGFCSVADLKQKSGVKLTNIQKIGLKYFEDLDRQLPRAEVQAIEEYLLGELTKLFGADTVSLDVCGQYRRGQQNISDYEMVISRKDSKSIMGMANRLVGHLFQQGFLRETMSAVQEQKTGNHAYTGIAKMRKGDYTSHHCKIELKVVPKKHYGYALLNATGCSELI